MKMLNKIYKNQQIMDILMELETISKIISKMIKNRWIQANKKI